jgi:transposase
VLAPPERRELKRRARKRSLAVELVKRAEVILMLAAGHTYREVRQRLDCSDEYIREWKRRFQEERLAGLDSRYRGSQRRTRTAETEARILEATRQGPTDGTTHWSSYRLAKELGISQSSVSRVWRHFGIQPHRVRGYMASDDPEFEEKAADIIGLYLKPPLNAAVFCVDEKSAIQALDRLDRVDCFVGDTHSSFAELEQRAIGVSQDSEMRKTFRSYISLFLRLFYSRAILEGLAGMLYQGREMLRRQGPEPVDPLIRSKEFGEIVTGRNRFYSEGEKMVLAVSCPLYFAQYVFGAVGGSTQDQEQDASFTNSLRNLP